MGLSTKRVRPKIGWKLKNNYGFTLTELKDWLIKPKNLIKRRYRYDSSMQMYIKIGHNGRGARLTDCNSTK